jgi:CRP/FNR family transcriptional regulator, anaerobic regulatory protein
LAILTQFEMERIRQNKELMAELEKHSLTAHYPAGAKIIGKELKAMPIVKSGLLKIMQSPGHDQDNNNILLYYVQPDETCIATMLQTFSSQSCTITAQFEEDSEIMFVPLDKAYNWIQKYPEWAEYIMQSYQMRFNELLTAFSSASAEKLETRVLKYLRQRRNMTEGKVLSITHQNMAADLATNRVVISRLLKTLENKGLIKLGRNKIEVAEAL